jgi:hypothetical protein
MATTSSPPISGTTSEEVTVLEVGRTLEFTPALSRVLLRIMRKAAERQGVDLDAADNYEATRLASPAS